ncbi:tetratricopeptide repeat protein [Amylibacter sp.]|nr:tetratricopeptide repeat protein [Amylibacter sp.]
MRKLTINQVLQQAVDAHKAGQLKEAHRLYAAILKAQPKHPDANHNTGLLSVGFGKIESSLPFFKAALNANPRMAQFWYSHIVALIKLDRLIEAKALLDQAKSKGIKGVDFNQLELKLNEATKAQSIKPNNAESYFNMGIALQVQNKLEDAIEAYKKTLSIKPDYANAYYNIGIALKEQNKLEEAIEAYNKALAITPDHVDAYYNTGIALQEQGKLKEAIETYNKVLSIKPDYVEAYCNMGNAFKDQGKLEDAIEAYNKALSIKPYYADAYYNMGTALQEQNKLKDAIKAYKKALAIKPGNAGAYYNMGIALKEQNNVEEAIEAYSKALAIKPDHEAARTLKLLQKARICNWDSIAKDINLIPALGTSEKHVSPFALLPLEDAPERHLTRSKIYAKAKYLQKTLPRRDRPSKRPKRIRIGYFSTDFKKHPVAYLIAKVLEQHNRDQFEVFGYSVHGSSSCVMRQRLEKSFDSFADVQNMSDRDIALKARQDEIDIAIDLNGYTLNARTGIFAYLAAPIQINYLGYPGSMGAEFIDYIVADQYLIPPESQKYFSEKQIYLPDVYVPTDNTLPFSNEPLSRFDLGLPDSGFVFCAINNSYKVNQRVFDIWMRLLESVGDSVLWLLETNKIVKANLEKEANKRGVASDRLVFAKNVSHEKYLSQFYQADLFLDTFPYSAGATASNALWAGLPIVTKSGQSYTARMAGSMLNAIGLPELITKTEKDYEALILELATHPMKLAEVKKKLAINRSTQPLFNTELYTTYLENGYQQAYQNYFDGKLPQTIIVPK